jgi:hypothetical protein
MTDVHEPAHARLGPSNHRWPNCPGSVREEANYQDVSGAAAIDGTGSHLLLELCLDNGVRAEQYDGQIIGINHHDMPGGWFVQIDRCIRVQMCLDYVDRRVKELKKVYPNVTVTAETKADVGGMFGRKDWWGTVDITITARNSQAQVLFIEVCDYKDGRMWVAEKNNTQLISYAAGKLRPHIASGPELVRPFVPSRVPHVRMSIVQPKTNPPVRYHDTTATDVMLRTEELSVAARRTDKPDAPLIPDKKGGKGYCNWCKHKKNCSAQSEQSLEVMNNMDNLQIGGTGDLMAMAAKSGEAITLMKSEELAQLADAKAGFDAIFAKVDEEITARIDRGDTVPGFAMVNGNSTQKWNITEEELVKKLRARKLTQDEYYPKKIISPAQVLSHKKLTDKQKADIKKNFISTIAGKQRLGRVEYSKQVKDVNAMFADLPEIKTEESVAQCATDVVDSVPEVSFF